MSRLSLTHSIFFSISFILSALFRKSLDSWTAGKQDVTRRGEHKKLKLLFVEVLFLLKIKNGRWYLKDFIKNKYTIQHFVS